MRRTEQQLRAPIHATADGTLQVDPDGVNKALAANLSQLVRNYLVALLPCIDHLYIINLPDRTDRRAEMSAELGRAGVDPASAQATFFPAIRPEGPGGFPSVGARGCFLSHLAVLKEARRRGFERFLIAEDDLCLAEDFGARADRVCAGLSAQEWSIFYGGYRLQRQPESAGWNGLAMVDPATPVQCTHFMGLRGDAVGEIIAFFEDILSREPGDPRGGPMHVDGAYSTYRHQRNVSAVIAVPELGYQRHSRSDVHDLRWLDRLPVITTATALARRAANWLKY